jgi:MFS family permease
MTRKQLAALFVCNLVPYITGNALLSLLPIYAIQLGGNEIIAGIYLSLAFGTLAIGTLISGWLSDRFQRRKGMIVLAACVSLPATFLMGQVDSLVLLTIFTMTVWFAGGVSTAMGNILTGMYADAQTRGRTFGIIGLSLGLAQIIGGAASGAIVDRWGYTALFTFVALGYVAQIIAGLFLDDSRQSQSLDDPARPAQAPIGKAVWLLIFAHTLASTTGFSVGLGKPLMMDGLGFDATAVTSTVTIQGLVALPLPLFIGWLSDRIGRTRLLMAGYFAGLLGALTLISATSIGQIWLSTAIFALGGAGASLGFAYVTDLSSPESLGTAMSRFSATPWIAGVIGFGLTGFVIQAVGLQMTFLLVAVLPAIAILLLFLIIRQPRPAPAQTGP